MHSIALLLASAFVAVALAEGEYYVPRAYYTIDAEGHASAPVPLRRLRRSVGPLGYFPGSGGAARANANANANANAYGGRGSSSASASANAEARSYSNSGGYGGWALPGGAYGSANPTLLGAFRH